MKARNGTPNAAVARSTRPSRCERASGLSGEKSFMRVSPPLGPGIRRDDDGDLAPGTRSCSDAEPGARIAVATPGPALDQPLQLGIARREIDQQRHQLVAARA